MGYLGIKLKTVGSQGHKESSIQICFEMISGCAELHADRYMDRRTGRNHNAFFICIYENMQERIKSDGTLSRH